KLAFERVCHLGSGSEKGLSDGVKAGDGARDDAVAALLEQAHGVSVSIRCEREEARRASEVEAQRGKLLALRVVALDPRHVRLDDGRRNTTEVPRCDRLLERVLLWPRVVQGTALQDQDV